MQTLNLTKKYEKYTEYKDSGVDWLGKIPKEWRVGKVKETFNLLKEKSFNNSESEILSLTLNGIKTRDVSNNEGQIASSYEGYRKIIKGDIVLNPMDLIRGFVDSSKYEGIISPAYSTLRKIDKNTNSNFYGYFFQKHYFEGIFYPFGNGVSVDHRWTLKDDTLVNFPSLIVPSSEQTKIANYLDEKTKLIEEIIEKKEKLIELLKEKRTAVINNAVTKGLDKNVQLVESGVEWIGKIPRGWNLRKIFHLFHTIGSGTTPDEKYLTDLDGGIPWVNTGDLTDSYMEVPQKRVKKEALKDISTLKMFSNKSIVIAMYGATIGKLGIPNFDFCTNQACCVLENPIKLVNEKFIYYWLLGNKKYIIELGVGGGQPNINKDIVKSLKISLPSKDIQELIVSFLDEKVNNYNIFLQKVENSIELLKEFKTSLISNVVTGKIKV